MNAEQVTAELMALADAYVAAAAREGYMPGGFAAAKSALEQAIRRAVDWEHVATITPFSRVADESNVLDKTFPVGTALYARRQDQ